MKKRMCRGCLEIFVPQHRRHVWCRHGCYYAALVSEIGVAAAGMQPLGLLGDRDKIVAFNKKNAAPILIRGKTHVG